MNHDIESTVTLKSGFELSVRFDYTVTSHHDIPAVLHLAPEDCSPADFEFLFDVEDIQISNWGDKWWDCEAEKLIDLIIEQLDLEVYEHYQKNF